MLQLQNVIEGMKEQMVRLENYREKHKQRKYNYLAASRVSSRATNPAAEDGAAASGDADAHHLLEETKPSNFLRGSANVMGA
jgi:hypothetical protein